MEYRAFRAESVKADDSGKLVFLVTPFGRETTIGDLKGGGFREEVGKGCFAKTLKEGDALMVYQHDLTRPLARMSAGNLELAEGALDSHEGLVGKATPADTSYARDLRALVDAKVITGMSFGFNVVKDEWFDDEGNRSDRLNGTRRILREVQLIEVSPVTRPAYGGTAISARDQAGALLEERRQASEREERAPKPYGDVPYADPANGKYPIDKAHVKAAWAYINQRKNAAKYPLNGVTLKSVKDRIRKAMQKFGFTSGTAAEAKFEFASGEWRDDDPYLDDWYEIDDEPGEAADGGPRSENPYAKVVAAVLAGRADSVLTEVHDLGNGGFCVVIREDREDRDDPDGKEYAAIDNALRALRKSPPDVKAALSMLRERQGQRDDPDGQEFMCIDHCIRLLEETPPDVKGAKNELAGNQMYRRDSDQEPDASTPDSEDEDLALRMAMRSREIELESI